ncbi:hypothetical protein ACP4OV_000215 [Aristida adscensionis]
MGAMSARATLLVLLAALVLSAAAAAAAEVRPAGDEARPDKACRQIVISPPGSDECDEAWCKNLCSTQYNGGDGVCAMPLGCQCTYCHPPSPATPPPPPATATAGH